MKKALALGALLGTLALAAAAASDETVAFGRFGTVRIFSQTARPEAVIIWASGENGWDAMAQSVSQTLAGWGYAVIGVDSRAYLSSRSASAESCLNAASDLIELGQFARKRMGLNANEAPVLAGYSLGATLVYAALCQSSPTAFQGAVSLAFGPELDSAERLCRGATLQTKKGPKGDGRTVLPCPSLDTPWIVIHGRLDKTNPIDSVETFVSLTRSGQLIELPGVGHDFAPRQYWMPRFQMAIRTLLLLHREKRPPAADRLEDLPLVVIPASPSASDFLAVHLTGDGGYGVTDQGICEGLAKAGIPAVALNSLKYFWTKKTPRVAAKDLERILEHFLSSWKKEEVVLCGYSLGADVLPFMVNGLPDDLRARIRLVGLLGPGPTVNFEFHLMDWVSSKSRPGDLPVLPQIQQLGNVVLLCFYGQSDKVQVCGKISLPNVKVIGLPTKHRFGRNYEPVVDALLGEIRRLEGR